jgi:hypothetical protein
MFMLLLSEATHTSSSNYRLVNACVNERMTCAAEE